MIVSNVAEKKIFDKIQLFDKNYLMKFTEPKNFSMLEIEGDYFKLIKTIYTKMCS